MKHISQAVSAALKSMPKVRRNYESTDDWPGIVCGPSKTKQSFSEECDINNIMKRYEETGQLPEMIKADPQYGDFSDMPTYQEAQNVVIRAQEQFMALPAKVRSKFQNDPALFLDFATNPENSDELIKMGLASKRVNNDQPIPSAVTPSPASSAPKEGDPKPQV